MSGTESPDFDRMAEGRQILQEARQDRDEIALLKSALECYSIEQARLRTALIDMLSLAKTISPCALSTAAQARISAAERALGASQQQPPVPK